MFQRIVDGRTDLVFEFVDAGNEASSTDDHGVSLIKWCAYYGDVSAIRFLLAKGESLASLGENFDLHGAAFHGQWRLCQFLLEYGADANHRLSETGESPLHSAIGQVGNPAHDYVVRVLLSHKADPNCKTEPGKETGSFMRDCNTRAESPLHRAAAFASEGVIKTLLEASATVNVKDTNGDTPLAWASWYGRSRSILRLLCYDGITVMESPAERIQADHALRHPGVMAIHLLGKPHV